MPKNSLHSLQKKSYALTNVGLTLNNFVKAMSKSQRRFSTDIIKWNVPCSPRDLGGLVRGGHKPWSALFAGRLWTCLCVMITSNMLDIRTSLFVCDLKTLAPPDKLSLDLWESCQASVDLSKSAGVWWAELRRCHCWKYFVLLVFSSHSCIFLCTRLTALLRGSTGSVCLLPIRIHGNSLLIIQQGSLCLYLDSGAIVLIYKTSALRRKTETLRQKRQGMLKTYLSCI